MIALGPRELAKAGLLVVGVNTAWLMLDRIVTGIVQCSALGCLPW